MGASPRSWLLRIGDGPIAPVDVRHDSIVGLETDPITSDVADVENGHGERGFRAGRKRVDGRAAARLERTVAIEDQHDGGQSSNARAVSRIANDAANRQAIRV